MKKVIAAAGATLAVLLGPLVLAPAAWALVPPMEPGSSTPASTASSSASGLALWQVIGIALVAVAIGAVGTVLAQRTYRQSHAESVSMA